MEGVKKEVAQNIRKYRNRSGLTQIQLAEKIAEKTGSEIGKTVISNWENEISSPDLPSLFALCVVLSVTPTEMMGVVDEFASIEKQGEEINRRYQAAPDHIRQAVNTLLKHKE